MRITRIALFAGAAVLSMSAFAGPQGAGTERVVVTSPPSQVYLTWTNYSKVQGEYGLEDGRVLTVTGKNRTVYADFGDGPVELIHVGKNRFVAPSKDMRLSFHGDQRRAEEVRVTEPGGRQILAKR